MSGKDTVMWRVRASTNNFENVRRSMRENGDEDDYGTIGSWPGWERERDDQEEQ